MASTIKIKNSSTAGAVPTAGDLVQGELAVNVTDKTIFTENASGTVVELGKNYTGFKNRIINGAIMIDQRNAGASVTNTTSYLFGPDRWKFYGSAASKFTVQQNAGSVTPPVGFVNYLGATSSSAYSVGAAEQFIVVQPIEGLNVSDLSWGTASAATVTLSFKVYSSLTGTFGGSVCNSAANRTYPFTYTISAANTWTTISVTVAGDTTGTWLTTNGVGMVVQFSLGAGSTLSGTAGAWAGSYYASATGATSVVGTSGATFYITGVQLEKGSTATSFDYRPYGTELSLCQRYYEIFRGSGEIAAVSMGVTSTTATGLMKFAVTKRAAPTMSSSSTASNFAVYTGGGSIVCSAVPSYSLNAATQTVNSSPITFTTTGSIAVNQSLLLMILGSSSDFISASSEL